jgi:hypothetical protein
MLIKHLKSKSQSSVVVADLKSSEGMGFGIFEKNTVW